MTRPPRPHAWAATRRLTAAVVAAWLALTLATAWFAPALNAVSVRGFPLGYWLAAQGALLAYVALIGVYVAAMDRIEARHRVRRGADAAAD